MTEAKLSLDVVILMFVETEILEMEKLAMTEMLQEETDVLQTALLKKMGTDVSPQGLIAWSAMTTASIVLELLRHSVLQIAGPI